jgi:hypothetical protein
LFSEEDEVGATAGLPGSVSAAVTTEVLAGELLIVWPYEEGILP